MKRKLQVLLMAMLLPLVNIKAQDSVFCVHDQFLQEFQDSNSRKGDIFKLLAMEPNALDKKIPICNSIPSHNLLHHARCV